MYELSFLKKKIFNFFLVRVPPFIQKSEKKNVHPDMTIHTPIESPYRVHSKHVVFKIIYLKSGSKSDQKCRNSQKLVNFECP